MRESMQEECSRINAENREREEKAYLRKILEGLPVFQCGAGVAYDTRCVVIRTPKGEDFRLAPETARRFADLLMRKADQAETQG